MTVLEENEGSNGNGSISELEQRVETLEGITAQQETRIIGTEYTVSPMDRGTTCIIVFLNRNLLLLGIACPKENAWQIDS